jgi:hypothetical protein
MLARQAEVESIRTQIELTFPSNRTAGIDVDRFEDFTIFPRLKNAPTGKISEVNFTFDSVCIA